ncbi:MAG: ferrous iron transport protein A [Candidatus Omnitrophica bacterium]|nr:ferrous iron transport protein A [Candidatus Omnitrophota bacterium]
MLNLVELKDGQAAKVVSIDGGKNSQEKLKNLGLREGVIVKKIRGMFTHGPIIVKAGQTEIALGRGLAVKVIVGEL